MASTPSTNIVVDNSSFEFPIIWGGGDPIGSLDHWTQSASSDSGVMYPNSTDYTSGEANDGAQVGYVNNGTISQTLAATLAPKTTYKLQVDVGDRLLTSFPSYSIGLYAGGVLLKQVTQADFPGIDGEFVTATLEYVSPSVVSANQLLEIRLSSAGTQVNFDNVRLSSYALPLPNEFYSLDLNGNRQTLDGQSQSLPGTHNRLQTDGTFMYAYDNEGNVIRKTRISNASVTDYTWDNRNQLKSVTEKTTATGTVTQKVEYVYDAFGRRIGKLIDTNGDSTWDSYDAWIMDGQQEVIQLKDTDGQGTSQPFRISDRYLYGDAIDQLLADEQNTGNSGYALGTSASVTVGNTLWPLTDHLGSVRDLVDNNSIVRQHVIYDSFGIKTDEFDYDTAGSYISSDNSAAIDELFGYTGRDWDADVGLQYNRARWYDPTTGRWMSQDPIGFEAGDTNLYRYVGNHPTSATDPSGLEEGFGTFLWYAAERFPAESYEGFKGLIWDGPTGFLSGIGFMLAHPVKTSEGLGYSVIHLDETIELVATDVYEKSGSSNGRGQLGFDAFLTIATAGSAQGLKAPGIAKKIAPNRALFSSNELASVERASAGLIEKVGGRRAITWADEGTDALRYLNYRRAEAASLGADDIILRRNPGKAAVLEEFLHGTQQRLGIIERLGRDGAEHHVKDFMIRHRKLLGLGDEDVGILRKLMELGL